MAIIRSIHALGSAVTLLAVGMYDDAATLLFDDNANFVAAAPFEGSHGAEEAFAAFLGRRLLATCGDADRHFNLATAAGINDCQDSLDGRRSGLALLFAILAASTAATLFANLLVASMVAIGNAAFATFLCRTFALRLALLCFLQRNQLAEAIGFSR